MTESHFYVLLVLSLALLVIGLFAVLRKQVFDTPAEMSARMTVLEQNMQALLQSTARAGASSERIADELREFTERTTAAMNEQFVKSLAEARSGRAELAAAFSAFGGEVDKRLGGMEATFATRLGEFQTSTSASLDANRKAVDEQLTRTLEESRNGRQELSNAFTVFADKVEQRLGGMETTSAARLSEMQTATTATLEASRKAVDEQLTRTLDESRNGRHELTGAFRALEEHIEKRFGAFDLALGSRFDALQLTLTTQLGTLAGNTRSTLETVKLDINTQLGGMSKAMATQLEANGTHLRNQLSALQETVATQLAALAQGSRQSLEDLRASMNERLGAIQQDNTAKLEEMRRTVDEKLHATLEQRLGESFKLVSERLEQVHSGLGEMKNLAGSVGDLKRVMTNVRTRGTWGEVQLGAIIESLLTAEQFERNVKTVPGSNELVEFAIKMPGKSDDMPVWLPIDSKYPVEPYQVLLNSHETMDKAAVDQAAAAFTSSIRMEAKKIASKYLSPPYTTDFAVLFLPTEGLFAEVARVPGLIEALQTEHRVVIAGPTTLAAMLNSLRLGFRTLAIEKRSSEVWNVLGTVKTEFRKFEAIVDSTKKSIDAAANKFAEVGRRTRAINRGLQNVEELPASATPEVAAAGVISLIDAEEDDTDVEVAGT